MKFSAKKFLVALSLIFALPSITLATVFIDVSPSHPNAAAITYLYENQVIGGYEDGTFRPEKKVNRAEALKIILLGSNVMVPELQPQEVFPDVLHDAWYGKFVAKAKNLQIVSGDSDTGLFRPSDTVNLAEALKILLLTNNKEPDQPGFNPYADVSRDAWYAPYFAYAQGAGLLDKSNNDNVNPSTPITRAALAELMYRLSQSSYIQPDGEASYYGEKFHGKTTASGAIFDASAFTAAHRTYPFGTWLKVTNVANGKSVVVEVNDRGPYAGENRIIDLSKAAFESIASLSSGVINVKLEETSKPSDTNASQNNNSIPESNSGNFTNDALNSNKAVCAEVASLQMISKSFFKDITLDQDIPNRMLADEILTLSGTASNGSKEVTAFLVDSNNKQLAFTQSTSSGKFDISIRFPGEGTYKLGVLPGDSGQSVVKEIKVQKNNCIEEVENTQLAKISGLSMGIENGDTIVQWSKGNYNLFKATFTQGNKYKNYIVHDLGELIPSYREFADFNSGDVQISIRGANLNDGSILQPSRIEWSSPTHQVFRANDHHEYTVDEDEITLLSLTKNFSRGDVIEAKLKPKVSIRSEAAVIIPNGNVEDINITSSGGGPQKNVANIDVYTASNDTLTVRYTTKTSGIHFLEVNNDQGLAVINVPVYLNNEYPLLPSLRDLSDENPTNLSGSVSDWRNQMLKLINQDRSDHNLSSLILDGNLSNLAQSRSNDMVANNYFSHWDQQGRDANDLKANYGIQTLVGENLARDINLELAEYGLMRSAIHRSNILSKDWTRVGLGITQANDGGYVIVQIFSGEPIDLNNIGALRNSMLDAINKNRGNNMALQDNLNSLGQNWSEKMANEEFFDFVDKDGNALVDTVRDAGVTSALGTYILGNSSFGDALEQMENNTQVQESKWKNLGVGIKQDKLGIINITLIYTE